MSTISIRPDEETEAALKTLGATPGNRSRIVKEAILLLAQHREREQLRQISQRLASDPDDVAEMHAVLADMEDIRAR